MTACSRADCPNLVSVMEYLQNVWPLVERDGELQCCLAHVEAATSFLQVCEASSFCIDAEEYERQMQRPLSPDEADSAPSVERPPPQLLQPGGRSSSDGAMARRPSAQTASPKSPMALPVTKTAPPLKPTDTTASPPLRSVEPARRSSGVPSWLGSAMADTTRPTSLPLAASDSAGTPSWLFSGSVADSTPPQISGSQPVKRSSLFSD